MSFNEYASFDGLALGRMVRELKVTPAELMDAAIARAEKHNAKLNAIVFKDYDRARATARAHAAGDAPFAGVPLLLKDIMGDCAGMPTRSACAFAAVQAVGADPSDVGEMVLGAVKTDLRPGSNDVRKGRPNLSKQQS